MTSGITAEDDYLLHQQAASFAQVISSDPRWFERLYFNVHEPDGRLLVLAGFGVFPNAQVADGYFVAADEVAQRNVRVSRSLVGRRLALEAGPLRLEMLEPMKRWHIVIDEHAGHAGLSADLTFNARTMAHSVGLIQFRKTDEDDTAFQHYFQSGRYEGHLVVDGVRRDVDGWLGHRDHSWGLRRPREFLGLHLWIAGQFEGYAVTASYNEDRDGNVVFCEGAILPEGDTQPVRATDLFHRLEFVPETRQVTWGTFRIVLEDGRDVAVDVSPTIPDVWMAGAGYGGWQGKYHGELAVETERWTADDGPGIADLPLPTSDQLARFTAGHDVGVGIFEVGLTRSRSYTYRSRW